MADYDSDILEWSERQAELLRRRAAGDLVNEAELDWPNIAEEIEDVGRSELHAVESLLVQALRHMLKAEAWPQSRDAPSLHRPCARRLMSLAFMSMRDARCPQRWTVCRHSRSRVRYQRWMSCWGRCERAPWPPRWGRSASQAVP
jgi:hypothetical protein